MCDPVTLTIAAAAATAVMTGAQAIGQIQEGKAQERALNAQNAQRQKEIDQSTTAEINDRLREQRREQGRIAVAAGEAGLSLQSGSVETMLMDSYQQAQLADDRSLANRESRKLAAAAETQAKMPSRPTALGAGLQIAGSALSGATSVAKMKAGG